MADERAGRSAGVAKVPAMIHVCPMSKVDETVSRCGAAHLVTLLAAGTAFARPDAIPELTHLCLWMNDIAEMRAGLVVRGREHVERLLAFARSWNRRRPLAVNCYAGVSRSTVATYIVAAAPAPERDEAELAWTLRLA